MRNCEDYKMIE